MKTTVSEIGYQNTSSRDIQNPEIFKSTKPKSQNLKIHKTEHLNTSQMYLLEMIVVANQFLSSWTMMM